MSRITDRQVYQKLYLHNAWTNTPLDLDSLGAGGSRHHLIFFGTQTKLGHLMTNSEIWELIDSIGTFEYETIGNRPNPIKVWFDEYKRLNDEKQKVNHSFCYQLKELAIVQTKVKASWEK